MRKREFINARDVVLVSLRDFQDDKCDIIGLYDENQVRKLKELNEIPSNINLNEDNEFTGLDDEIHSLLVRHQKKKLTIV